MYTHIYVICIHTLYVVGHFVLTPAKRLAGVQVVGLLRVRLRVLQERRQPLTVVVRLELCSLNVFVYSHLCMYIHIHTPCLFIQSYVYIIFVFIFILVLIFVFVFKCMFLFIICTQAYIHNTCAYIYSSIHIYLIYIQVDR